MPLERPLYQPPAAVAVESQIAVATEEVDADLLFSQTFVDQAHLVEIIRSVLPEGSMALLSDVIATHPIEQGAAEIVGYLALNGEDVAVDMDDTDQTFLEYSDPADPDITKRARLRSESDGEAAMSSEHAVASAIIRLMQGVVYRESDEDTWLTLERLGAGVRDHFATIGIDVIVDDAEGFGYLRSRPEEDGDEVLPRLVRRRALTYNVSLLLVLLRKRLVEFETAGGDSRLVLTTDQIVEMLRLFQAESTNDARVVDQAEMTINKARELGFLRQLRGQSDHWEVRRILKAYVDAQTLSDFATKLIEYAGAAAGDE